MTDLEAKVQRLERTVRRLVTMLAGIGLAGMAGLLAGASQPNRTVEATRFVLKHNGQEVAVLGTENGEPSFSMLYRGRGPWKGGATKLTATSLTFSESDGGTRLSLEGGEGSSAGISILDTDGRMRLAITSQQDLGSFVSFQDKRQDWHLQLGADDDGTPFLDYVPKGSTEDVSVIPKPPVVPERRNPPK